MKAIETYMLYYHEMLRPVMFLKKNVSVSAINGSKFIDLSNFDEGYI
jgi:hypothetical protein